MGVEIHCGRRVDDLHATMDAEGFDAAFLAVGAQIPHNADIPAGDTTHVLNAVSLLRGVEDNGAPSLGRRVAVYGGGDTAMDAARTAKRLGAEDTIVVYRRTRDRMPAHDEEVEDAVGEGVRIQWLSTVKAATGTSLVIEKMVLDESGFPRATGEMEELQADSLVLALGQEADLSLLWTLPAVVIADGVVQVGPDMRTGHPGVFAGGDMVSGPRTLTDAVGQARHAVLAIDAYLSGAVPDRPPRHPLATADRLNTWYYADAPKTVRPRLEAARRASTFDEVVGGLDETTALFEARRCLSCGNCFGCDNCFGVCPDNAVLKVAEGHGYRFDYDYCKGCGLCVEECPCGAIDMVPEEI
jgi:2-oxoacid:acceptor oxidoreductase delta subunit (pyruvate/2-ketoisovalerate family)